MSPERDPQSCSGCSDDSATDCSASTRTQSTSPAPVRETYFAFWWKPSNPWQNHPSNLNTIADLFPATSGPLYIVFKGSTQTLNVMPEFENDTRDLPPNVTATSVTLGAWHLIEWYVKYSST